MLSFIKSLFSREHILSIPDNNILMAISSIHARSPSWRAKRNEHIMAHPFCAVCGSGKNLTVHHIMPYHLFPDLELVDSNLITLCEGPVVNCHFLFGHMRNWRSYNPKVIELCKAFNIALENTVPDLPSVVSLV